MLWKATFWTTLLCVVPYLIYFVFNRANGVGWPIVLTLGMILAWALMYFVLFKATELPKI